MKSDLTKITLEAGPEGQEVDFYVLEQTRIAGRDYLLVTDAEDGDGDAYILEDISADGEKDATTQPAPAWSRRIELPFRVNADKANAKFTDGILRIELPKAETAGIHRIAIAG